MWHVSSRRRTNQSANQPILGSGPRTVANIIRENGDPQRHEVGHEKERNQHGRNHLLGSNADVSWGRKWVLRGQVEDATVDLPSRAT